VADALDANAAGLVDIADAETRLGAARLAGEVARTTGQLRLFAHVIAEGSYLEAVIDSASNFPFAFSVAGGDTESALAVGWTALVQDPAIKAVGFTGSIAQAVHCSTLQRPARIPSPQQ
jgi:NADP-dependent aldehyde dehydrogenase